MEPTTLLYGISTAYVGIMKKKMESTIMGYIGVYMRQVSRSFMLCGKGVFHTLRINCDHKGVTAKSCVGDS